MKFIVSGALGHIGSKLIRSIPIWFPNCQIIMIDNMSAQRYCSLFNLPKNATYRFIEEDINNLELSSIIKGSDALIHLAAITNAAASFSKAKEIENNNFKSTEKVALACLSNKVPLIYISSTSVYGTAADQVDENCSQEELNPQSPYAESKLKEEDLIKSLGSKGLEAILFRFGTIFGVSPGMRFHTAVNKFCWQATIGEPLSVWTTAYNQLRPYLDLEDAMNAFRLVFEKNLFNNEIYNVLTGNYSVKNIVEELKCHIENVQVEFVDSQIMNQLSYEVLDSKFCSEGFKKSGNLSKGIKETISLIKLSEK